MLCAQLLKILGRRGVLEIGTFHVRELSSAQFMVSQCSTYVSCLLEGQLSRKRKFPDSPRNSTANCPKRPRNPIGSDRVKYNRRHHAFAFRSLVQAYSVFITVQSLACSRLFTFLSLQSIRRRCLSCALRSDRRPHHLPINNPNNPPNATAMPPLIRALFFSCAGS